MSDRELEALARSELEVLKVLWDEGPATVRQALERLHGRGRRVAYTTVQTFLNRLEAKGLVRSDKSDLAHIFHARVKKEKVLRSRLRDVVEQLFDGAAGALVVQLLRDERLTRDEISELQKLIDRLDGETKSKR